MEGRRSGNRCRRTASPETRRHAVWRRPGLSRRRFTPCSRLWVERSAPKHLAAVMQQDARRSPTLRRDPEQPAPGAPNVRSSGRPATAAVCCPHRPGLRNLSLGALRRRFSGRHRARRTVSPRPWMRDSSTAAVGGGRLKPAPGPATAPLVRCGRHQPATRRRALPACRPATSAHRLPRWSARSARPSRPDALRSLCQY